MFSLITKIAHSTALKDTIAVARGIYQIVSTPNSSISQTQSDWITGKSQKVIDQKKLEPLKVQNKLIQLDQNFENQTEQTSNHTRQEVREQKIDAKPLKTNVDKKSRFDQPKKSENAQKKQQEPSQKFEFVNTTEKRQNKQSKVISSRFGRIFEYGKLGKWMLQTQFQAYLARATGSGTEQQIYERGAHKITQQLCKMRGAPLKVAQMLSIQQDNLIPAPIRKAFEKARQQAHIMPESQVKEALNLYLGNDWSSKLKSFELRPFAAASIGQVHKGISIEGEELAIKLQYPGVEKSIQSDMKNLKMLLKLPGILPKGIFLDKLLANTEKQLRQQCDYQRQASMHSLYDKCLLSVMPNEYHRYGVPKIYKDLTTKYILTSKFLQGVGISRFEQEAVPQHVRNEVGRLLMKLTFSQIFEMGIMQSDPNPSNFTYNLEAKRLNLFDFGATHIYDQSFLTNYCGIINASVAVNKEEIVKQSILAGFLTNEQNSVMLQNHIESILTLGQPLRWNGVYDFGNQKITQKIYKTIPQMLKNRLKSPPQQIYSLHRKLSGAYLACIRMRSQVDCRQIFSQLRPAYKIQQFV